jgi:hypothetical protein
MQELIGGAFILILLLFALFITAVIAQLLWVAIRKRNK